MATSAARFWLLRALSPLLASVACGRAFGLTCDEVGLLIDSGVPDDLVDKVIADSIPRPNPEDIACIARRRAAEREPRPDQAQATMDAPPVVPRDNAGAIGRAIPIELLGFGPDESEWLSSFHGTRQGHLASAIAERGLDSVGGWREDR